MIIKFSIRVSFIRKVVLYNHISISRINFRGLKIKEPNNSCYNWENLPFFDFKTIQVKTIGLERHSTVWHLKVN